VVSRHLKEAIVGEEYEPYVVSRPFLKSALFTDYFNPLTSPVNRSGTASAAFH
jgi:hypothetical protein